MAHSTLDKLRILSWNLWFDDQLQIERLLSILSYIEPLQPDVIGFQEMTSISDAFFADQNIDFSRIYHRIRAELPDWQWYWEGLYSRLPIGESSGRFSYRHSEMGRGITILHVPEYDLVVGCTHLESENEHALRRDQLSRAILHLEDFETRNIILVGDTNARKDERLNDLLPRHWRDAWEFLKPDDPGYTVNSKVNPMGYGKRQARLDRCFYYCKDFQPTQIKLVGTEPEKTESGQKFLPSDHFGLLIDFVAQ